MKMLSEEQILYRSYKQKEAVSFNTNTTCRQGSCQHAECRQVLATSVRDVSSDRTLQVPVKCFTSLCQGVKRNTANRLGKVGRLLSSYNRLNSLTLRTVATKLT